jgi:trimethylamine--corrinoid protein Co-methyltransferase
MHILDSQQIDTLIDDAFSLLESTGVRAENTPAIDLLAENGAHIDSEKRCARLPRELIESCLKSAPDTITLYDRDGNRRMTLGKETVHFNPGSSALSILDYATKRQRQPTTNDLKDISLLTDSLKHIEMQSTSLISGDVPMEVADSYRVFVALQYCAKPIITGTFSKTGFDVMKALLMVFRQGDEDMGTRPFAIFDCCPSSPLRLSDLTCRNLMQCARSSIPAEIVSMPMTGMNAPAHLCGAIVQHTAENLSALVLHQIAQPGSPVIWGGSPAAVDMRFGTTPMGAIETMMLDATNAAIGKRLHLPTHAYIALSDAKGLDAQAGFETGMGAVIAALSGIDVISGPGMLDFERCQSLEKLVIDNEICGMAKRLRKGIALKNEIMRTDLRGNIYDGDHFLTSPSTLDAMRSEYSYPSSIVDRRNYEGWLTEDGRTVEERAHDVVGNILAEHEAPMPQEPDVKEMKEIMRGEAEKYGLSRLPA